jgi:hypothetical protein
MHATMNLIVSGETISLSPEQVARSDLLRGFAEVMPGEAFTICHPKVTARGIHLFFDPSIMRDEPGDYLQELWAAEFLCADIHSEMDVISLVIEVMQWANEKGETLRQKTEYLRSVFETGTPLVPTPCKKFRIFQWSALCPLFPPSFATKVYRTWHRVSLSDVFKQRPNYFPEPHTYYSNLSPVRLVNITCENLKFKNNFKFETNRLVNGFSQPFFNHRTGRLEKRDYFIRFFCCENHLPSDVFSEMDKWRVLNTMQFEEDCEVLKWCRGKNCHRINTFSDFLQDVWFKSFERSPFDV